MATRTPASEALPPGPASVARRSVMRGIDENERRPEEAVRRTTQNIVDVCVYAQGDEL